MAHTKTQNINIELSEKEAEGIYSNLALISHSSSEFILDFARMLPGVPKAKIYARIVMTPQNIKSLQKAIEDNISKYEAQFGKIKTHEQSGKSTVGFQQIDQGGEKGKVH